MSAELGKPGTPDGPPDGNFLMEGHWRRTKDGKVVWVEPNVCNPAEAAEAIAGMFEFEGYDPPEERDVEYCDYCEKEGHSFRACPARDDENEPEEAP